MDPSSHGRLGCCPNIALLGCQSEMCKTINVNEILSQQVKLVTRESQMCGKDMIWRPPESVSTQRCSRSKMNQQNIN